MTTMKIRILVGDALVRLRDLPDESVQCVVTSPPYWGLRDYGNAKWEGGDPECEHEGKRTISGGTNPAVSSKQNSHPGSQGGEIGDCVKCGARKADGGTGDDRITSDWSESVQGMTIEPEPEPEPEVETPPVQKFSSCSNLRAAGWKKGVSERGGTYQNSWDAAEIRTYALNNSRLDRDKDGHACEKVSRASTGGGGECRGYSSSDGEYINTVLTVCPLPQLENIAACKR